MNQETFSIILVGSHILAVLIGIVLGVYGLRKAASVHEDFIKEEMKNSEKCCNTLHYDPLAIDDGFSTPVRKV
jgi:hypothetical protein